MPLDEPQLESSIRERRKSIWYLTNVYVCKFSQVKKPTYYEEVIKYKEWYVAMDNKIIAHE